MTEPMSKSESTEPGAPKWAHIRADGSLGAFRRALDGVRTGAQAGNAILIVSPGPRWVPEPHMESALSAVLEADPGLAGVVGWWRWQDAGERGPEGLGLEGPVTVRVGGRAGDDLNGVDLLARPMSVGPIAMRRESIAAFDSMRDLPADAVLDNAMTWMIATHLVVQGMRVGTLPRTCSTRTRTHAEDPEALRPIGLAWLVRMALGQAGPDGLRADERRELFARWGAAPEIARPSTPAREGR